MTEPSAPGYTQQEWQDKNPSYPLSALRMKHIEKGVSEEEAFTKAVEEYTAQRLGNLVADVTTYGADRTGATDTTAAEQLAIEAAAAVGGTVYYPPGTYLREGTPQIPVNLVKRIRILGAGRGATTFKLKGTLRCFDFAEAGEGDTLGNVELSDFTVDGESKTSASGDHVVVGTLKAGALAEKVNILNVAVRRVATINIATQGSGAQGRRNVLLSVWQKENGGPRNEIANVSVEDCEFEGGNYGVGVMGQAPTNHSANVYHDNIFVRRIKHICPLPTNQAASAHVHIGSVGYGRKCVVEDVYGTGSADVGIELDNLTAVSCSRCLVEEAWNECFLATNFVAAGDATPVTSTLAAEVKAGAGPVTVALSDAVAEKLAVGDSFLFADTTSTAELVTVESVVGPSEITVSTVEQNHALALPVQRVGRISKQRMLFSDCRGRREKGTQGEGFQVQNSNNVVPIGEVVLDNCTWYRHTTDFGSEGGEGLQVQCGRTGFPRALRVSSFEAIAEGVAYTSASAKLPRMIYLVGNQNIVESEIDISGMDLSYSGTGAGSGGLEVMQLYVTGVKASLRWRNIRLALNLVSSSKKLARLMYLQANNNGTLRGTIDGVTIRPSTNDEKIRGIQTGTVAGFSQQLSISAIDGRGLPEGSTDVVLGTEAGRFVTIVPGANAFRLAPTGASFTPAASGEPARLEKGYSGALTLVGGTGVTKVEVSADGVTYQAVLTQTAAALPPLSVPVVNGMFVKVTYTTVPTAIFMPAP